ncbi:T9SS type A sorting domain-containing protein [Bacteroidia bacterium]|jgi:hypothetical protein|nr:T9SS type A sorting domain-containing protein [Bacteroidia bacterium]
MRLFWIILFFGFQLSIKAQKVCSYWPLDRSFGAYEGVSIDTSNVMISVLDGQSCAVFKRPVDGVDHGLEIEMSEKQKKTFTEAPNTWLMFDFYAGEQFTNFDERVVQIGSDDNFMIHINDYNGKEGTLKLFFQFAGEYSNIDVKANTWTRCIFLYNRLDNMAYLSFYSLNKNGISRLEASRSIKLYRNINLLHPLILGNKNFSSPDKLTGGIKNVTFGVGSLAMPEDLFWFSNLSSLPQASVNEEGNLIITKINQSPYKVGGQLQYPDLDTAFSPAIVPLRNIEWVVQGNSAINDDYTFISKSGDSIMYDAWIDRGDWVTLQVRGELGYTGEIVKSNIIRHYVEENTSRTDEIEMNHVVVIQENETLQLKHQLMAATQCKVYNMTGQIQLNWDGNGVLDISNLHDGAYVLRVIDKEGIHFSHKFIK